MRKHLSLALALAMTMGISSVAAAAAGKPTVVRAGNVVLTLATHVSPTALPRDRSVPIGFEASGTIASVDGSQPPALKEVVVDIYKGAEINVKGVPVCRKGKLEADSTRAAEAACPGSILGRGRTTVRVAFPESTPFSASGPLVYYNGGEKGGVTTLYVQTYVAVPVATSVVTTIRFTKERKGPYGLHAVASLPPIAGGAGSVTKFSFSFPRTVTYAGYKHNYILADCPTGTLSAHVQAVFSDGTNLAGQVVSPCTPTG
jgi:hypothetical protein